MHSITHFVLGHCSFRREGNLWQLNDLTNFGGLVVTNQSWRFQRLLIITRIEIKILWSFTVLWDERKRQIDFKSMPLVMVNFFHYSFHVVDKGTFLIVQIV